MFNIRFESLSRDLLDALVASGWNYDRKVDAGPWMRQLEGEGYQPHPLAEEILARMGGLSIEPINSIGPNFTNEEPYNFDPLSAGSGLRGLAVDIEHVIGGDYFPIGEWLSYSSVFVEAGGRVVAAGMGWIWELGSTFEESLQLVVCADRPLVCLHSNGNLDPWPRADSH